MWTECHGTAHFTVVKTVDSTLWFEFYLTLKQSKIPNCVTLGLSEPTEWADDYTGWLQASKWYAYEVVGTGWVCRKGPVNNAATPSGQWLRGTIRANSPASGGVSERLQMSQLNNNQKTAGEGCCIRRETTEDSGSGPGFMAHLYLDYI